ncbi:hypothetical protein BCR35DRAFT_329435 [Leucosporidium creatinivorum]|uniref:Protein kinase domain-containing protein n=1 Tax=Leucosporidium creatinivorum TaxID=106004 RepID=A0A1Y2G241_9BASI|nr:hypothetical protein BCR35DRAFT_329435 [Leucosporidium creatinivorum]
MSHASPIAEDWWRWPTPTKEDATGERPFREIGGEGRAGGEGDGGRVKMLGEWRVGGTVGKGTNGRVRLARSTITGDFAAVKKVKRVSGSSKHADVIHREISMMKLVEHPHILQLRDVFETPTHFFLVTDYCPHGEVFHYLISHNLSADTIYKWFAQLISALTQLQLLGIAHRDIKFENLFLYKDDSGSLSIKLGDLGMASFQPEGQLLDTSCGSPHYAAPEVILGIPYDGGAADIWSSGVVLYALFARQLPFDDDHIPTLLSQIKKGYYEMHDSITGDARDLVLRMIVKDVKMRISLADVSKHPYLTSRKDSFEIDEPYTAPRELDPAPRSRMELEEDVLENLKIVLRVKSVEEAAVLVMHGSELSRARQFYSTLHRFKTKLTVIEEETSAVRYSKQARRSISLPDFPLPPRPAVLAPAKMDPPRPRSGRGHRQTSSNRLSIITEPESAPSASTAFAFPTIAVEPSSRRRSRRAATDMLPTAFPIVGPQLEEPISAPAHSLQFDSHSGPPAAELSNLSIPQSAGLSSTFTDEEEEIKGARTKKVSMQQRIKALFRREGSNDDSTIETPLLQLSVAEDLPPASPLRDSFLKRSTGYASLHRAIVGLAPGSPSPSRASYVPSELGVLPRGPTSAVATPKRKKSWLRRSPSPSPAEHEVDPTPPTPINDENDQQAVAQLLLQPYLATSPASTPTPSPTKRRPSPLTLVSSNITSKSPPPAVGSTLFAPSSTPKSTKPGSEGPLLSPKSPPSIPSSNENDSFGLGSPFQSHPPSQQASQPTTPSTRRPSKTERIKLLEEENATLQHENQALRSKLLRKQGEVDALRRETRELWRRVEEGLEGRRDAEVDRDELKELVKRLSFGEDEEAERGSVLSEKLEERWMRMLGVEVGESKE